MIVKFKGMNYIITKIVKLKLVSKVPKNNPAH
jgi:hypothetical protein